jgi:hypothetical protein
MDGVSQFRERFGRDPNLETPASFNEKIHWLRLHYKLPEMTRLADKYEVRTHGPLTHLSQAESGRK